MRIVHGLIISALALGGCARDDGLSTNPAAEVAPDETARSSSIDEGEERRTSYEDGVTDESRPQEELTQPVVPPGSAGRGVTAPATPDSTGPTRTTSKDQSTPTLGTPPGTGEEKEDLPRPDEDDDEDEEEEEEE